MGRVVGLLHREIVGGEDRVALELMDHAPVALDRLNDHREVLVQRVDELLRRQPLGDGAEAGDIGEERGAHARLRAQHPAVGD